MDTTYKSYNCGVGNEGDFIYICIYIYTTENYSAIRKNEIMNLTGKQMIEHEKTILRKVTQTQENKHLLLPLSPGAPNLGGSMQPGLTGRQGNESHWLAALLIASNLFSTPEF